MRKKRPLIQDIAVIARSTNGSPIGEALQKPDYIPMTDFHRKAMVGRLDRSISDLMDDAHKTYLANCNEPGTHNPDPDYITRLSTNEFFFYTKEPLTLKEFQELQNKIANKAATLPSGVQLILGSFAVKTDDNKVMNVTPHITCGAPPDFQFIVKNYTSQVDVRYKVPGTGAVLDVFDFAHSSMVMPKITVNGVSKNFSFDNIIHCRTPGGTPFITAVDVCLDHAYGVAKDNYQAIASPSSPVSSQPVSHVVVSNWIPLNEANCLGSAVMHADPVRSPQHCKAGVAQERGPLRNLPFGNDVFRVYRSDPEKVHYLDEHVVNTYEHKILNSSDERDHTFYKASIENANFKGKDTTSTDFQNFKNQYHTFKGDYLKTKILENFKDRIQDTTSKTELDALKDELKNSYGYDVLKSGQGLFTRLTGIDTSSVKALDSMIKQQEENLAKVSATMTTT